MFMLQEIRIVPRLRWCSINGVVVVYGKSRWCCRRWLHWKTSDGRDGGVVVFAQLNDPVIDGRCDRGCVVGKVGVHNVAAIVVIAIGSHVRIAKIEFSHLSRCFVVGWWSRQNFDGTCRHGWFRYAHC